MHLGYCLASSGLRTGNTSSPDETPRRTARRGPTTHVLEQRTGATWRATDGLSYGVLAAADLVAYFCSAYVPTGSGMLIRCCLLRLGAHAAENVRQVQISYALRVGPPLRSPPPPLKQPSRGLSSSRTEKFL